jgi:NAD(P)-dependent dehydrogenase (short-subunit alcohol dehydrogenase family)
MLRAMPGALVTGAGGGLGLAIAERLAGRGYDVTLADIDGDAVEREAERLGERAHPLRLDVTDLQASRAAAAGVAERAGSLDVWVNNAGIRITGRTYEQELEAHRRMLEVNAIGTYNGTIAALELMRAGGRGHVINVVSLAGLAAAPGIGGYAASKHAAIAFSLSTLADLRHAGINDIHISCVCPDGVWTPMIQERLDDPHDALSYSGKMLMPDEVAARVERLVDKPKPVVTIPRWRGRFVRFFDSHPRMAIRLTPMLMKDALRRQARFREKVAKGKWPPR